MHTVVNELMGGMSKRSSIKSERTQDGNQRETNAVMQHNDISFNKQQKVSDNTLRKVNKQ